MNAFLVAALIIVAPLPGSAVQVPAGVITGTIKLPGGEPAVYVRVGAMRAAENSTDVAADAGALFSQTQTDEAGRYRLEGIPPGKYYIVAGRLDDPTYYSHPATLERMTISIVSSTPVDNIDFSMTHSAARPPDVQLGFAAEVRIRVTTDDGSPLPVASPSGRLLVNAVATPGPGVQIANFLVQGPGGTLSYSSSSQLVPPGRNGLIRNDGTGRILVAPQQYRLSLSNLPDDYEVKSMTYTARMFYGFLSANWESARKSRWLSG